MKKTISLPVPEDGHIVASGNSSDNRLAAITKYRWIWLFVEPLSQNIALNFV
jgi:hypothetical protein